MIETSAPIKPVDLLRCFIAPDTSTSDAFFQSHELRCSRPAQDVYPLVQDEAIVEVLTAKQRSFYATVRGDEIKIGNLRNDDFPFTMRTRLVFPESATAGARFALKDERTLASLAAATREKPVTMTSPFSLWGVAIRAQDSAARLFVSSSYEVPSGDFKVGFNFYIPDNDPKVLSVHASQESSDGRAELALIAPASGDLALNVNGRHVRISGPGSYVLEGETLRKEAVPAPATPPDVVEPPAAPTCGADGQAPCPSGACAAAHRLDGSICKACGTDGKTYCGSYNQRTCAAEHRLDGDLCKACGADGQTYCGGYNQRTCDVGHRVDGDLCRACGTDGKTYCGGYNQRTCEPGHRLDGDLCRACGASGQTYCGSYNQRSCNAGLRVVGDTCAP